VPPQGTSEEPGLYAEAAVDGNHATAWAPDGPQGSLTADLTSAVRISRISIQWNEAPPASFEREVSLDGQSWTAVTATDDTGRLAQPVFARYVRVAVQASGEARRPGIRELEVIRAPEAGEGR
jgi:hypothetical protein